MTYYVYASHMGGLYTTEEEQSHEDLYCDTCADSDQFVGQISNKQDVADFFAGLEDWYDKDYVKKLQAEWEDYFSDLRR